MSRYVKQITLRLGLVVVFIAAFFFYTQSTGESVKFSAPFDRAVASSGTEVSVSGETVSGIVFEDLNQDGEHQADEPGIPEIIVSNGRDVTLTDSEGAYSLPVFDNMTVMVSKPSGYRVPLNEDYVPQFSYIHKPEGTPTQLRYGGIAPTGPLPDSVDFPLTRSEETSSFSCVVMGDTQPYSNTEIGYVRDTIVKDLLAQDLSSSRCMILLGDVIGDDLNLLPRFMNVMGAVGLPQYYIHGNHDYDFDANSDEDSADSWRRIYGPNYFSFEIGDVFFAVLDNVVYPCGEADSGTGGREACTRADADPTYNARVPEQQMTWLQNTLEYVPKNKLVVLMHHIPLVSFIDSNTGRHQTDNANDLYQLLEGRPALSLSGHTHTYEILATGESYKGWQEQVEVSRLPFDHIVGGAPSGNWWQGDFSFDGIPMAFTRGGTPPGYLILQFDGADYRVDFYASNQAQDRKMALSFNTPAFRSWFTTLWQWQDEKGPGTEEIPPLTVNDLEDLKLFTPDELAAGVYLTANVWSGERNTEVMASIDGGDPQEMVRTQAGEGEDILSGAEYADPFAVLRQLTIGRYAYKSTSGDERAQGFEIWQGSRFGPVAPQGMASWGIANSSTHLWRLPLSADLPVGSHVARVTVKDRYGREFVEQIPFEVRTERPFKYWDNALWEG